MGVLRFAGASLSQSEKVAKATRARISEILFNDANDKPIELAISPTVIDFFSCCLLSINLLITL